MNNREISRSCSKSFDSKDASESRSPHSDTRDRYFNAERSISRERSRKRTSMGHYGDYRSKRRESQRIRSRSRSSHRFKNKYSRSRSKSYTSRKRRSIDRHRSNSRSPNFGRRRHIIPQMSRCLGVFGLSVYTTQSQIMDIFSKFGPIDRVQVIIDAKSGRSRGYCFVYYEKTEDAKVAKEECCGMEIDARRIRVDYSITQRPHTPTPGVYMGRPLRRHQDYYNRYRDDDDHYDRSSRYSKRSPSPYKGRFRRYERSRSRTYSPRDRKYR